MSGKPVPTQANELLPKGSVYELGPQVNRLSLLLLYPSRVVQLILCWNEWIFKWDRFCAEAMVRHLEALIETAELFNKDAANSMPLTYLLALIHADDETGKSNQ
jgi:hypothetical protein